MLAMQWKQASENVCPLWPLNVGFHKQQNLCIFEHNETIAV
jgi:hypothetical protein